MGAGYVTIIACELVLQKGEYIDIRPTVAVGSDALSSFQASYEGAV